MAKDVTSSGSKDMSPLKTMTNGETDRRQKIPRGLSGSGHNSKHNRKLVLHFDVRNTILVADSVDNISVEQALNSFLTGVTWGKDTASGWKWSSDRPTLVAPDSNQDTITYYKHLEAQLVKVPSDRAKLRRMTGDFTQEPIGCKFAPYFHSNLKHLEWPFHKKTPYDKQLTMSGNDGKLYHYILPSFYNLLRYLNENERDFCVVIRTYGLDAYNVLQSIKITLEGKHPQFPEPLHTMRVNTTPGAIRRKGDIISIEQTNGLLNEPLKNERDIYERLTKSTGISAYVDDFLYWQQNAYDHSCAKPLWLDLSQKHVHHIFFDDNIRVMDKDSIVDIRTFDSPTSQTARSLSLDECAQFEDMCLVQANLLESTSDLDYFIHKVQTCERKYGQFLQQSVADR